MFQVLGAGCWVTMSLRDRQMTRLGGDKRQGSAFGGVAGDKVRGEPKYGGRMVVTRTGRGEQRYLLATM